MLLALVALVFLPGLRGQFIWDDDAHVTANACIVGPLGFGDIWTSAAGEYFPLVLSNFWVQHAIWGFNPLPYHVVTLLFHAASAVLLWRILSRCGVPGAWLGAALWAIHPVQVESVAWISELKNTQSGLFYLLSIWAFVRWLDGDRKAWRQYVLALVCAVFAFLSKPSTVMLPAVLALVWFWRCGSPGTGGLLQLAPFAVVATAAAGWAVWEQKYHSLALGSEWNRSWAERMVVAGRIPWFYLGKLAWPHPLIFFYPRWSMDPRTIAAWLPLGATLAGVAGLWRLWVSRRRAVAFAGWYFLLLLAPVLGFFDAYFFRYSFVGDHFQYLASIGPLALVAAAVSTAARRLSGRRMAEFGAAAVVLGACGGLSARQCAVYRDDRTLWADTLRHDPASWAAENNLGIDLAIGGAVSDAEGHFERALSLNPHFAEAHYNLGYAEAHFGRLWLAIEQFRMALRDRPAYPEAEFNLGNALLAVGERSEAMEHFRAALRIWPGYTAAREMLARFEAP